MTAEKPSIPTIIGLLLAATFACSGIEEKQVHGLKEEPATDSPERSLSDDGAPMVLIPAGEFQMGSRRGYRNERPVHAVHLDAFYMDKYEVTNALYRRFVDATGHEAPTFWYDSRYNAHDQPVVGVTWHDARAYCKWAGKRLPTEAEWEKAARGGLSGKEYPRGDDIDLGDASYYHRGISGGDRWDCTPSVGSFAPNAYGLHDMAGSVSELCLDWYGPGYYEKSPGSNPRGPSSGKYRMVRGGSWLDGPSYLRLAYRPNVNPTQPFLNVGFRCVRDTKP